MKNSFKPLPPFKGWVLQNFPFIEEDFDAITSYQLWCKVVAYLNNTNNNVNVLASEVLDIKNYFDNLDVQEEIDNKLDEMAESGQLTDIIAQYLQLAGILAYNTLDDLKGAENLADGSFTRIYGKLTYNDGYGAFYKIRTLINTDVIDNDNLVALTNYPTLVAEKMKDSIIDKLELTEMVVFGDSWTDGSITTNVYPQLLANTLNLALHNYGSNGAGFVNPTTNLISTEVTNFLNSNVNKAKVKYIVLFGGINDYRQGTTANQLASAITTEVNRLKLACPQAKILYASNCQYPYTMEQSYYWNRVHAYLSTSAYITTFNLDGIIGIDLFDNTLFHLTTTGQEWLTRNFLACLSGGEIFYYPDIRDFSDDTMKARVSSYREKDHIIICFKFKSLTNFTNHTLSLSDVTGLSWVNSLQVIGFVDGDYNNVAYALRTNSIVVAKPTGTGVNKTYETNIIIPIVNNVEL